jgi:hypothetical protein
MIFFFTSHELMETDLDIVILNLTLHFLKALGLMKFHCLGKPDLRPQLETLIALESSSSLLLVVHGRTAPVTRVSSSLVKSTSNAILGIIFVTINSKKCNIKRPPQ